jgi:hypothetical protein
VPRVGNESARFVSADRVIPDGERRDQQLIGWTFARAAEAALEHLSDEHRIVRIVGPSGFGKSRFTYELFNNLRLVTVDVETRIQQSKDTLIIHLEPAPDELIAAWREAA